MVSSSVEKRPRLLANARTAPFNLAALALEDVGERSVSAGAAAVRRALGRQANRVHMGRRVAQRSPCHSAAALSLRCRLHQSTAPPDKGQRGGRAAAGRRCLAVQIRQIGHMARQSGAGYGRLGYVHDCTCRANQQGCPRTGGSALASRSVLGCLSDSQKNGAAAPLPRLPTPNKAHAAFSPRELLEQVLLLVVSQCTQQLVRAASSRYDLASCLICCCYC